MTTLPFHRLYVFGNSGSGKSSLARSFALETGALHIDLDEFAWTTEIGVRRPVKESVVALREKLREQSAVVEGMYSDLVSALATRDDALIWLDVPLEECVENCKSRPFEPHKWESPEAQDRFLPRLLEFLPEYSDADGALGRAAHAAVFEAHEGKKLRLLSSRGSWRGLSLLA